MIPDDIVAEIIRLEVHRLALTTQPTGAQRQRAIEAAHGQPDFRWGKKALRRIKELEAAE